MTSTVEQYTELEELEIIYCELHKDVYGVKARWYRAESVEQARQDIWQLGRELEVQMEQEKKFQEEAIAVFKKLADSFGGVDTARRWQHQAYGTHSDEELEYYMGLPYGYFRRALAA